MAIVELTRSTQEKPHPLSDIAEKCGISLSYLEQLVAALRKHKIVKSFRGPGGGYILAKPLTNILISDVLMAAEDSIPAKRNEQNKKEKASPCPPTDLLWEHISEVLYESLKEISIDEILRESKEKTPYSRKKIVKAA